MKGEGNWPEAVRRFREAVRLDPELPQAHFNLAEIRAWEGGLDEAIGHYRRALEIDPEFTRAEYMLGVALVGSGPMKQANECYQRARRLDPADATAHNNIYGYAQAWGTLLYHWAFFIDPNFIPSHNNLGLSPGDADRLHEAIGHYEKALQIEPGFFTVDAARGQALLGLGRFRDALAATRRCLDRLPQGHELSNNVLAQLKRRERLIALEDRLPAVLKDENKPTDMSETLEFAELCGILGHVVSAARLYGLALATSPQLARDLRAVHCYRAACAAALAGSNRGDGAALSRAERARWRKRAREWLRKEVALWTKALNGGSHADCVLVRDSLTHLWADPDLAGLLDREPMDELSAAERQEGHALWSEIDALIRRAKSSIERPAYGSATRLACFDHYGSLHPNNSVCVTATKALIEKWIALSVHFVQEQKFQSLGAQSMCC